MATGGNISFCWNIFVSPGVDIVQNCQIYIMMEKNSFPKVRTWHIYPKTEFNIPTSIE